MIEISTFNLLISVAVILFLYSVIDHRNALYANTIASFMAGLVFAYLGVAIDIGAVSTGDSGSLGWLLIMFSTFAFAYTMFMTYEILDEAFQKKAMLELQEQVP